MKQATGWIAGALGAGAFVSAAAARPVVTDIQFVTVGAPGNPAYFGPNPPGSVNVQGRGRVDYEYRIGKYEVTTAQWMEFTNTYTTLGGQWTFFANPVHWGAVQDPFYSGPGIRHILDPGLPNAAMSPVYGISWREAAMFTNWLHNDKASGLWAIKDGAYDTSTFTTNGSGTSATFNDQLTHHPDAKYWIPTFDEWTKASHYDPDRYGPGQGGYWQFTHRSDAPAIGAPPGEGEANTGFFLPNFGHLDIPLGSYPETLSPWGMLDTAGMTNEHTEFYFWPGEPVERGGRGSSAGGSSEPWDRIYAVHANLPQSTYSAMGLRVAAAVPAPASLIVVVLAWMPWGVGTRRRLR